MQSRRQSRKIRDFCLKQGHGFSAPAAPPSRFKHPLSTSPGVCVCVFSKVKRFMMLHIDEMLKVTFRLERQPKKIKSKIAVNFNIFICYYGWVYYTVILKLSYYLCYLFIYFHVHLFLYVCIYCGCYISAGCSGNGAAVALPDCGSRCFCSVRWTGTCCETRRPWRNWGDPHLETLDGKLLFMHYCFVKQLHIETFTANPKYVDENEIHVI